MPSEQARRNLKTKVTYPMCMEYYEPEDAAVFALVSKEIQIMKLK